MQENTELEKQLLNDDDLFKDSDEYVVKNINSKIKPNIKNTIIDDDDIDDVLNDLGVGTAQNKPKVNPKDNYLKNKKKALFLNSDDTTPRDEYKKTDASNKPKSLLNKHKLDGNSRDMILKMSKNNKKSDKSILKTELVTKIQIKKLFLKKNEINWEEIYDKLPSEKDNPTALKKRKALFKQFDLSGDGMLTIK